jgi:hypothetical protein
MQPRSPLGLTARTRRPIPSGSDCVDSLYALAYLTNGDPECAQRAVLYAFSQVRQNPTLDNVCQQRRWVALADQVLLATQQPEAPPPSELAPFRNATLARHQREAIALHLGGQTDRQAARLLGGSLDGFYRSLRSGLTLLLADNALRDLADPTPQNQPEIAREDHS